MDLLLAQNTSNLIVTEIDFDLVVRKKLLLVLNNNNIMSQIQPTVNNSMDMLPPTPTPTPVSNDKLTPLQLKTQLIEKYKVTVPGNASHCYRVINNTNNQSALYYISADLRNVDNTSSPLLPVMKYIADCHTNNTTENTSNNNISIPTLFISECVLVYMNKLHTNRLLSSLLYNDQCYFTNYLWCSYDMVNPNDRFGKQLLKNLSRYCLSGLLEYPTLVDRMNCFLLKELLNNTDIATSVTVNNRSQCITMLTAYNKIVSMEEKKRIAK